MTTTGGNPVAVMEKIQTEQERLHSAAASLENAREALIKAMADVDALTLQATSTDAAALHAAIGNTVAQLDDARQSVTRMASKQTAVFADFEMEML